MLKKDIEALKSAVNKVLSDAEGVDIPGFGHFTELNKKEFEMFMILRNMEYKHSYKCGKVEFSTSGYLYMETMQATDGRKGLVRVLCPYELQEVADHLIMLYKRIKVSDLLDGKPVFNVVDLTEGGI